MNLKPNKLKMIVSVIMGLSLTVIMTKIACIGACTPLMKTLQRLFFSDGLIGETIILWVFIVTGFIITYALWSSAEKKK